MPDGDELVDDPAGDLDMRRSIRFARGKVSGVDALLLLSATRNPRGKRSIASAGQSSTKRLPVCAPA